MTSPPGRQIPWVSGTLLCAAVLFGLLLALPGQTVPPASLNDLFIFLDGPPGIGPGRVPNLDFHAARGALPF